MLYPLDPISLCVGALANQSNLLVHLQGHDPSLASHPVNTANCFGWDSQQSQLEAPGIKPWSLHRFLCGTWVLLRDQGDVKVYGKLTNVTLQTAIINDIKTHHKT